MKLRKVNIAHSYCTVPERWASPLKYCFSSGRGREKNMAVIIPLLLQKVVMILL
jgi:hypothetical protein